MITPQPNPIVGMGLTFAVLLAAVFVLAAVTKLASPAKTTSELAALGVPAPAIAARLLPALELALAVSLIAFPPQGAVVASAAIIVFTAVLLRAIRSGAPVSCGCLGALSSAPAGPPTIARNGALLAMSLAVLAVPEPAVPDLASALAATSVTLAAAVGIQLFSLHDRIGRVWSVALAGESDPRARTASPHRRSARPTSPARQAQPEG